MKFKINKKDTSSIIICIALVVFLVAIYCFTEFYLFRPERLILNRLNAYGIQVSEISIESQGGSGRTKTYPLSNPPTDLRTGQALAHWAITRGGNTGMIVLTSCTDVPESVSAEPEVLSVEQERLLEEYEKLTGRQKQQLFIYLQSELENN